MSFNEGFEPSDEEHDAVKSIGLLLAKIPDQLEDYVKLAPLRPSIGSVLADDDAVLGPLRASQLVETCLVAAADCLMAIELLMVDDDGVFLYTFAQYPLLRTIIEASTQVLWLLGPEEQRERVIRNLRARTAESKHDETLYASVPVANTRLDQLRTKKVDAERSARADIAEPLGIAMKDYEKAQLGYSEIVREGARHTGDEDGHAVAVWRLISGFSHPYTSRFHSHSIRHTLQEFDDGSVLSARLPSAAIALTALTSAQVTFVDAMELATLRTLPAR